MKAITQCHVIVAPNGGYNETLEIRPRTRKSMTLSQKAVGRDPVLKGSYWNRQAVPVKNFLPGEDEFLYSV